MARPDAAAAARRSAASAAAASYTSASVWYTSSCMAADRSGTASARATDPAVALTIAGSDPSGGAGIQADLKTFHAFGVYGAAVLTALTVQNTRGVRAVHPVRAGRRGRRSSTRSTTICRVAAAKIGLVPTPGARRRARRSPAAPPAAANLVLDPVLVAGSGDALGAAGTAAALRALLPCAALVTPNLAEAAALTGRPVRDRRRDGARPRVLWSISAPPQRWSRAATFPAAPWTSSSRAACCTSSTPRASRARARTAPAARCRPPSPRGSPAASTCVAAVARARRFVQRALAAALAVGGGAGPSITACAPTERRASSLA